MSDRSPQSPPAQDLTMRLFPQALSREKLYELVWKEPMLRVATYFGVSSSYLARVCKELRVPRPPRGHWAKLEFGKNSPQPPLPETRPGDLIEWNRGQGLSSPQPPTASSPKPQAKPKPPAKLSQRVQRPEKSDTHELVVGAKSHFTNARENDVGLLRPSKRLLIDVVTSRELLDVALGTANALFLTLSERGHRVMLAPSNGQLRRADVDEREVPRKNHYHQPVWSPNRPTVAYIANIPIGLTLFEMTEEVEVVYVRGDYLPIRTLTPAQIQKFKGPLHWTTTKSVASGRLCLHAYCPQRNVTWSKDWRERKPRQLLSQIKMIARELETAAPGVAQQIEDSVLRAEAQRKVWEEERQRERIETERKRRELAQTASRQELLAAIASWEEVRRIHAFFASAELELHRLDEPERSMGLGRLDEARTLIGRIDLLDALMRWKTPEER